ncbi:MAG: CHAT domain-containing tetratricopeptide repeat protein [Cellulophaga sp.]
MKKRLVIAMVTLLFLNSLVAQNKNFEVIEKLADSLYYAKSKNYKENDYLRLQQLRNTIIANYLDTINSEYKAALSKKNAADALYLSYKMEYDSAIILSEKSIKLYKKGGKRNLFYLAHLHKYLYAQYLYAKDWDNALLQAIKTRDIFKDTLIYNHKLVADAEFDIGYALGVFEDYDKIIIQYKKGISLNISNRGENNEDVAKQEHHLALIYGFVGFYKKELESYLKVVKRWEAIEAGDKDMSYLSIAYGSLCTWYTYHGDFEVAEQYLIKKENLVKKYKNGLKNWFNETFTGRTKVNVWYNYANLYLYKKDTLNALVYNKKILDFISNFDFNDKRNNPHNLSYYKNFVILNEIKALSFKADVLRKKKPKLAKKIYEEALLLEKKEDVSIVAMDIKLNLIELYIKSQEYEMASNKLDAWITDAKERNGNFLQIQLMAEKASLAIKQNDIVLMNKEYELVFKKIHTDTLRNIPLKKLTYSDCIPYGNQGFVDLVLKASINYRRAYFIIKDKKYLQISHNLSLLASEIFAANFTVLNYNDNIYTTSTQINEQLLSTTLLLDDETIFDGVLQKIEQSNSRLNWRKFLSSNQRKHLNIPDSILSKEEELNTQLHFYKKELFTYTDSDKNKPKLWKERIFDLQKEIEALNLWYQKNYKSYFNQTQKSFDIKQLKSKLKKKQKIIKYVFVGEKVYCFVISKDNTQLYVIADKAKLSTKLKRLIKSLSERNNSDFRSHAKNMYALLLPPKILDVDRKEQLIFILDGILHYLPMEVLVASDGKYLIENHAVSYAPSLLLWSEQIGVKKSKRNKLGIFAPTYKKKGTNNNPKRNENYDLLGANEEAVQISKLFKADFFTGNKSSKEEFTENAQSYSMLHLAMHSTINNIDSEFSYLAFPTSKEDDKLFISELYNMSLNADLAVLSACNTSVGNLEKGKGLINVSRAFTYAGVPSTVTSLWKVPDQETSQIMISFYRYLKKGKSKNKALQLAKLDYLYSTDDNNFKHPYYWAGFVISGDITPITVTIPYEIYVVLILVLLIGIYFFRKKRNVK